MTMIEFKLQPVGSNSELIIDGELQLYVKAVTIHAEVDGITTATVEYVCSQVETMVSGDVGTVIHVCPQGLAAMFEADE